jgi:4-amino-4-deoxy-L-arabinose transferase-like glycosyltransferase
MNSPAQQNGSKQANLSRTTWSILTLGVLLRVIFFLISDNNGTDAIARAYLTADWLAHPSLRLVYSVWPPLHFWLMGGVALLIRNVELAGRLLSLLTGVASLWLFWKIARNVYSETTANLSLWVFALYSLHIGYCTTSSSEAPFLFFVLGGLLSFLLYQNSGDLRWIALSGFSLTLSAAIRYEGWVVIFGVGLVLVGLGVVAIWHKGETFKCFKALVVFGVTGGSWPVFWMVYSWMKWKHPLYIVAMNHLNVANTLAEFPTSTLYRLSVFPVALFLTLSPVAFAAALYALRLSVREPAGRFIAFLTVVLALVQLYQVYSGGVMAFARYTLTLGTLMAVMAGQGLERAGQRWFSQSQHLVRIIFVAALAINLSAILVLSEVHWRYSEKFGSISPRQRFPQYIEEVAKRLRERLGPDDAVVIDNYSVQSNIVASAAGLPLVTDRVFSVAAAHPAGLRTELYAFIEADRPKYIVYSGRGYLRPYLPLPGGCPVEAVISQGMKFRCLFANEIYTLYEISYEK